MQNWILCNFSFFVSRSGIPAAIIPAAIIPAAIIPAAILSFDLLDLLIFWLFRYSGFFFDQSSF
jgi:hypothetical protein